MLNLLDILVPVLKGCLRIFLGAIAKSFLYASATDAHANLAIAIVAALAIFYVLYYLLLPLRHYRSVYVPF